MDGEALDPESYDPQDWAARASTTIVQYVDTVRGATTGKALVATRAAVYFLAAGLMGIMLAVLFLIMVVRLLVALTGLLPFVDSGEVWMAYLILGLLFTLSGRSLWKRKTSKPPL